MEMLLTLKLFEERYEKIMGELSLSRRDIRLGELMEEMEKTFQIPVLKNTDWESLNPGIVDLYQRVSNSRVF